MSVLRVRAHLSSPVALSEPLHLDSVTMAVHPDVRAGGTPVTRSTPPGEIHYPPIPIHRLRVDGRHVYLSSSATHEGGPGREHFVRRRDGADVECLRRPVLRSSGPGRDYLLPVYTVEAPWLEWLVVGRRRPVLELLRYVSQVGGLRRQGYGVVERWEAVTLDQAAATVIHDGERAARYLPVAWTTAPRPDDMGPVVPPYWHRGLDTARIRPGTPCQLRPAVLRALAAVG